MSSVPGRPQPAGADAWPPPGSARPAPPPPRPVLLLPPLPPPRAVPTALPLPAPRAVPAALPLPAHPRPYFSVNGPKLPPAEPLPLFAKPKDRPTFEQLLAARTGPRVRRRSPLVGAMVDAVGIQVIILTMTMVIRTMGH